MQSLKIAINTRSLLKNRLDGIGWFTYQVVKRWVERNPNVSFYFLFDRPYSEEFIFGKNVTPIVVAPPARHPILWYLWYEWAIPRALDKINPKVFISLDTYTSVRWQGKKITAIHDIAFALFDGQVDLITEKFLRHYTPKYIATSDKIVTVSNATKNDLISYYRCPENKIIVSNNAPSEVYQSMKKEDIDRFRNENTDSKEYFIFVGSIHPRKNILSLLQAFEHFKSQHNSNHKLVVIGRMSWKYKDVEEYKASMKFQNDIIWISHSSPLIISKWMASATALIMVSHYEGFGVPIVEALASGTPAICSNVSSMPEVAGGGAILVSPQSVEEISNAMYSLSTDIDLRNELIEKGQKHIQQYNWNHAADVIWKEISNL